MLQVGDYGQRFTVGVVRRWTDRSRGSCGAAAIVITYRYSGTRIHALHSSLGTDKLESLHRSHHFACVGDEYSAIGFYMTGYNVRADMPLAVL